jgi:dTDP-4-dehydrorhamnose reductase
MSWVVVGAKGMLGTDLVEELQRRRLQVTALDLPEFDATEQGCLQALADGQFGRPEWVVNCAAYTAVDQAESEPDKAFLLNGRMPGLLAASAKKVGARLLHVSTDFVFDGHSDAWYEETAPTNPLSVYGASKLEGEQRVLKEDPNALVCRTAWLFGPNGKSFPRTILRTWRNRVPLRVVVDQRGCPTYTLELARVLVDLMQRTPAGGVYHTAGSEDETWHGLARRTIQAAHDLGWHGPWPVVVEPISSAEWPTPAQRPANSRLAFEKCRRLGIRPMAPLDECLRDFVQRVDPSAL